MKYITIDGVRWRVSEMGVSHHGEGNTGGQAVLFFDDEVREARLGSIPVLNLSDATDAVLQEAFATSTPTPYSA